MNGGAGNDDITARMGIGPEPILPALNVNLVMYGGVGDDRLDVNIGGYSRLRRQPAGGNHCHHERRRRQGRDQRRPSKGSR